MNNKNKTVCIFCASSESVGDHIKTESQRFARILAESGFSLLYGGTTCGLMKIVADAHKQAGGNLIGVIPQYMVDKGIKHQQLNQLYAVEDLSERKQVMLERSDYIVSLPGGVGTFDEFFSLLTLKQLQRHKKPMYLLNIGNFYQPMMDLMQHGIENKTIDSETIKLFKVVDTASDLLQEILSS